MTTLGAIRNGADPGAEHGFGLIENCGDSALERDEAVFRSKTGNAGRVRGGS